jgi:hypothetical protein
MKMLDDAWGNDFDALNTALVLTNSWLANAKEPQPERVIGFLTTVAAAIGELRQKAIPRNTAGR